MNRGDLLGGSLTLWIPELQLCDQSYNFARVISLSIALEQDELDMLFDKKNISVFISLLLWDECFGKMVEVKQYPSMNLLYFKGYFTETYLVTYLTFLKQGLSAKTWAPTTVK
jgi:hypothetical protein